MNFLIHSHYSEIRQKFFPYNLKGKGNTSDDFYIRLEQFSEEVASKGLQKFGEFIDQKQESDKQNNKPAQTREDDLLDILLAGVLWNEYNGKWGNAIELQHAVLNNLYKLRKKYPKWKDQIDKLRGKLATQWLDNKSNRNIAPTRRNFNKLVLWLNATGDFREEALRIKEVTNLLATFPPEYQKELLDQITLFATWFSKTALQNLNEYTCGTDYFLDQQHQKYHGREDFFFCGRKESEYHLNMVGAALMNRSLRKEFREAEKQILLLPTCMSANKNCAATQVGHTLKCTHCTPECNISSTSVEMEKLGIETVLIKHSSDFSKWLLPWANQKKTALIGTACVLNLLQGGFEMKRLGIPSQCIFLDYCGCQKHWKEVGIPTEINVDKVKLLVEK